jgi:HEAT repeat protein
MLRVATTVAAVLIVGPPARAQPAGADTTDLRQADEEVRRRLAPLAPMVREALAGKDRDAQRAALGIAADFPRPMAESARLPAAVAAFLMRDANDPELFAMGMRAYGRMLPAAADLARVAARHKKAESPEVRRATAEALATAIQNSAPERKQLAEAQYFIEVCNVALAPLAELLDDGDEAVERTAVDGVAFAARVVTDIYTFDAGPAPDEPKPKGDAGRFDPLRPVLRGLAACIPHLAKPLAGREPETRLAGARVTETLAVTRRTVITFHPPGEPGAGDPFAGAGALLKPTLAERVRDSDPQVRLAVAQALESLADALDARELLRQATTDPSVFVRWTAARALGRSVPAKPDPAAVADDVNALAKLTVDADPDVRTAALNALARFGPAARSATDAVLAAASRGDIEPRVAGIKALGALRLQRVAAAGLTRFGANAKAALPELRKAVLSDDPELRLAAAEAILAIERGPRTKEL